MTGTEITTPDIQAEPIGSMSDYGSSVASLVMQSGYIVFGLRGSVAMFDGQIIEEGRRREKVLIVTEMELDWLSKRLTEIENQEPFGTVETLMGREFLLRERGSIDLNWQLGVGWEGNREGFYRVNFNVDQMRSAIRDARDKLGRTGEGVERIHDDHQH